MKLAVLAESPADEAAIRILAGAILGFDPQPVEPHPNLRARGWPSVLQVLPVVIRYLHYRTDADQLIVLADSNHSTLHDPAHVPGDPARDDCRRCRLQQTIDNTMKGLRAPSGRATMSIAVGIAAPAIEAWYRCGIDPMVSEDTWAKGLAAKREPFSKRKLKQLVYGTDIPPLSTETACATREAQRLATRIEDLEQRFPIGFGLLAKALRGHGRESP